MSEQPYVEEGIGELSAESVRKLVDHLNRLDAETHQIATQIRVVRNYLKDLAWILTKTEGNG